MKTTAEKIAVMQAFERGEVVEIRSVKDESTWTDVHWESPDWDWASCDYRIKPAGHEPKPEPQTEPRKAREWWAVVSDVSACFSQHGVFAGHDLRYPYEIRVREVLPGDDDLRARVEGLAERERKAYAQFDAKAEEARTLRAEVEKLRADRDRALDKYSTFKRFWRERVEQNDRLRETLAKIVEMAKDGAA